MTIPQEIQGKLKQLQDNNKRLTELIGDRLEFIEANAKLQQTIKEKDAEIKFLKQKLKKYE